MVDAAAGRAWTVADVRAAEGARLAQVPEGALMQRAAAALAALCAGELRRVRSRVPGARVVLLVGAGNNGGDALWAGARLAARGARVDAVLLAPSVHAQGLAALGRAGGRVLRVEQDGSPTTARAAQSLVRGADLVVDGLVGLGGSPGLRAPAADVVAALPAAGPDGSPAAGRRPVVVAVDLPSGVDPDSGQTPGPHVRADVTVTFGAPKPCLLLPPAERAAGRVHVVDLGLRHLLPACPAVQRLDASDVRALWPVPGPGSDKYRGVVGVVAGSQRYPGAAVLAVGGALRAGAGMVRYVGPPHPTERVLARWPEAVPGAGRVQAWVLGPGLDPADGGTDGGQVAVVGEALRSGLPCVVDAGALAVLERDGDLRARLGPHTLLTPHAGEAARLLAVLGEPAERADVESRPLRSARALARLTGATVLLKGAVTLVAAPDGRVLSQADAPAWLATAGAGDVLAGIAGTLLAARLDPARAGALAAAVHGRAAAAASAGGPVLASDVAEAVPVIVATLLRPGTVGGSASAPGS